jgi:hypothetical protein
MFSPIDNYAGQESRLANGIYLFFFWIGEHSSSLCIKTASTYTSYSSALSSSQVTAMKLHELMKGGQ